MKTNDQPLPPFIQSHFHMINWLRIGMCLKIQMKKANMRNLFFSKLVNIYRVGGQMIVYTTEIITNTHIQVFHACTEIKKLMTLTRGKTHGYQGYRGFLVYIYKKSCSLNDQLNISQLQVQLQCLKLFTSEKIHIGLTMVSRQISEAELGIFMEKLMVYPIQTIQHSHERYTTILFGFLLGIIQAFH